MEEIPVKVQSEITNVQNVNFVSEGGGFLHRVVSVEPRLTGCRTCGGRPCVKLRFSPFAVVHYNPTTLICVVHLP
jgi:hypothetical protein